MKVLTKYFKVALCFLAFALCSFMFAFTPTLTAVQASELTTINYIKAINALKMPTEEVDYNDPEKDEFKIPLLKSVLGASSTNYTIRVIDPAGYKHDINLADVNNKEDITDKFFTIDNDTLSTSNNVIVRAKNDGEYKVVYIVTESERTYYSNSYKVSVANVSYELDFTTPTLDADKKINGSVKNLMPTKLAVSSSRYELPVAYAKIAGKDLTVGASGEVTNASSVTDNLDDYVEIKVTKDGAPQKIGTSTFFVKDQGKYYIVPSEEGVYTVEYSYNNSANRPTKTFTINVEEGYVASELKLASTPTMPKVELGKEITLPKLTVNAGDATNVDVNVVSIVVEKEGSNGAIKHTLKDNNFKFVMSPENFTGVDQFKDMVGNYRVTYTVKDVNGKTLTETFKISGVTVSSKPTIKLAYNFDPTASNLKDIVVLGAETELNAEYSSSTELVLPAVYVEDAVTTNYNDFTIIRTIKKGSTYYYLDNKKYDEETGTFTTVTAEDKGFNAATGADTNIGDTNKAVKFKFNTNAQNVEGTYYLEYRVITKQVKERESYLYVPGTTERFSFKVVEGAVKQSTPTVQITNLKDSSVKNTDDITVKITATDDVDTRLKNAVFTYGNATNATGEFNEHLEEVVSNLINTVKTNKERHILDDQRLIDGWDVESTHYNGLAYYFDGVTKVKENDTKNSYDLNLKGKTGKVNVIAVSINDNGKIATDVKTLTIKDTNDNVAPTLNIQASKLDDVWNDGSDNVVEFKIGQGKEVKLPVIYVEDDKDKTLSLNVMYYINSPETSDGRINYLSPTGKKFYYDSTIKAEEVQVIDGGTITTSETGIYYVAYTATDIAGNTSVMYFTFEVVDTSKPVLSVSPVSGDEITISGNTITGGKGTVIDFESTLRSSDNKNDYTLDGKIDVVVSDEGKGLDYQTGGNSRTSYVFNDYGTYYVTISGEYTTEVNHESIKLTADNKVIKVVIEKQEIEWLGEFDVPQYAAKEQEVRLPDVSASNGAIVNVTYRTPGSSEAEALDAKKVTDDNGYTYWSFTTNETSKGTYTVTYTATTDEDVLTKTFSVKVGDNVAPTFSFNKGELTQDLIYDGTNDIEYVLEVNKSKKTFVVKAVNNGKEVYSYNIGLKISDKDDTGSVNSNMSWTNLTYDVTGDNIRKGETTSTSTQYLISGTGKYELKLTVKDSYDNERTATINFNVVEKAEVKENKDTVVGAVLIVISLILLAGVILFFTFTGKKGVKKSPKAKKEKTVKEVSTTVKETTATEVENKEEAKEDVVVEETPAEVAEEPTEDVEENVVVEETIEEKVDEEPKSGDVE